MTVCPNPAECCKELTRIWNALGVEGYTGDSASEHVTRLRQQLAQVTQERDEAQLMIKFAVMHLKSSLPGLDVDDLPMLVGAAQAELQIKGRTDDAE